MNNSIFHRSLLPVGAVLTNAPGPLVWRGSLELEPSYADTPIQKPTGFPPNSLKNRKLYKA